MGKRVLLVAALLAIGWAGTANATGNIKAGQTVYTTYSSLLDAPWDTTISVTASTLDTLHARGRCSYITVCSATASMSFACRAVGDQMLVPQSVSTTWKNGRTPAVNYQLTTFTAATGEYLCKAYGPLPTQQLVGVIIDGASTGSITVTFEP